MYKHSACIVLLAIFSLGCFAADANLPQPIAPYRVVAPYATASAHEIAQLARQLKGDLADSPENPQLLIRLAEVEAEQGDLDSALEHAKSAAFYAPDSWKVHQDLAQFQLMNREAVAAKYQAERGMDLANDRPIKITILGVLLSALIDLKQNDEAEKMSRTWAAKNPKSALCLFYRGWVTSKLPNLKTRHGEVNYLDESISAYRKSLELDPTFAEAHYNLGLLLATSGDKQGALREFRDFLKNGQNSPRSKTVQELISQLSQ